MNKYDEIIYLAGLLTILSTASAIASDSTNGVGEGSLAQSVENLSKNIKANSVLENDSAIAKLATLKEYAMSPAGDDADASSADFLKERRASPKAAVGDTATHKGIAPKRSTPDVAKASFWWAAEQFDPFNGKLIQNWVASSQTEQIDMTVDWQLWTLLDYFDRYRLVNQFGTVARKHGYSLIIFDRQDRYLASYKYNADIKPPKWELNLENYGEDSLQVEPLQKFDEFKPQL